MLIKENMERYKILLGGWGWKSVIYSTLWKHSLQLFPKFPFHVF